MRIVCAWCGQTLGYACPFCGGKLKPLPNDDPHYGLMVCNEPPSTIYFDPDNMKTSHGICDECVRQMTANRAWADVQTPEDIANQDQQTGNTVSIESGKRSPR